MAIMKKPFYILTLLLFSLPTFAQTDSNRIVKIRKIVEQINMDSVYTTMILDNKQFLEHMTDGGGQLIGYFKNGKLVKIVETVYLSSCINVTEYYIQSNKLIFVYTFGKEFQYIDSSATFNSNSQSVTMECRFYFDNGKMIKSILKGSTRCGGQPDISWATDYMNECSRYKTLLQKK